MAQSSLPACEGPVSQWNDCTGRWAYTNGDRYIGEIQKGKPSGTGTLNYASGTVYVGEFERDEPNGLGTLTFKRGQQFVGYFKDGFYHGPGASFDSDGITQTSGQWSFGVLIKGYDIDQKIVEKARQIVKAQNVHTLTASPESNSAHNLAQLRKTEEQAMARSNLPACQGEVRNWDQCVGRQVFKSGESYFGEFKQGRFDGYGTFSGGGTKWYAYKYVGEFRGGMQEGRGVQTFRDGRVLSGEWKNNSLLKLDSLPNTPTKLKEVTSITKLSEPPPQVQVQAEAKTQLSDLEKALAEAQQARREKAELEAQLAVAQQQTQFKPTAPVGPRLRVHAMVIGNGAYQGSGRLDNPINDARAISAKLKGMGFNVTTVENADRTKLVSSLVKFSASAAESDLTLFFYAGHGVQISGTNYMLPTDTNLNQIGGVPLHGISLNAVVEQFLPGKTKLVFLDACRDNPLLQVASRSVSRGLAPISVSQGTLISYATKDGSVAADGEGKNSPFTKALLQHIDSPEDIAVVLRKVRDQVMRDTGGQQQPWEYGSLSGGSLILSAIRAK